MKTTHLDLIVGFFLALGIACLAYLSIKIARKDFITTGGYQLQAVFSDCTGLRRGSPIMIAGVEVGQVKRIVLQDFEANVQMVIQDGVQLQKDTIASVKTKGLIGEKYIELTPGAASEKIPPGGTIRDTEPALDIEGLISKFVHGSVTKPSDGTAPGK
jgi:phospholipid/cholesterol/gamma-HCH transport system substrate-binding protein